MKIVEVENEEDFVPILIGFVEKEIGEKIFTLKVLDKHEKGIDVIVVFEDKSIMMGIITVQPIEGQLGARLRANFI